MGRGGVGAWGRGSTTAAKRTPSSSAKYQAKTSTKAPAMAGAINSTAPIFLFRQLKHSTVELHTPFSLPITGRKMRRRRHLPLCLSSSSKPLVELEFLSVILFRIGVRIPKLFCLTFLFSRQPKPEGDGTYRKQSAVEGSGEKLLRDIMGDNKIELYGSYGKVMNCGGGGSCGTCIVQVSLTLLLNSPNSWFFSNFLDIFCFKK